MGAKLTVAFLMLLAAGCATPKKVVPLVHAQASVDPLPTPAPTPEKEYQIKPGDSLWKITEDRGTDPFLWPSLWKANRDFVKNPDEIETGEWLDFPEDVSGEEISWAVGVAGRWPDRKPARRRGAPGAQ